jgi:hypothetical protein
MLNNISYFLIFGKPLMMYLGITVLTLFSITAFFGWRALTGRGTIRQHLMMIKIAFTVAAIHATLGILAYF